MIDETFPIAAMWDEPTFYVKGNVGRYHARKPDLLYFKDSPHSVWKKIVSSIGERLRNLRKERNITQVEAAVAIGTSRSNLTKIETGEYLPGREVLVAAAAFYGVSLDWLTSGDKPDSRRIAVAENEKEALLLYAYRSLPKEEADPLLEMLLNRVKPQSH